MQIILIKSLKLYKYPFPNENISTYWIKDYDEDNLERNLISISGEGNNWIATSNDVCRIFSDGKEENKVALTLNKFYILKIKKNNNTFENAFVYICEENDKTFTTYEIMTDGDFSIGKNPNNSIVINNGAIQDVHAVIKRQGNIYKIFAKDDIYGIYVNNKRVQSSNLSNGDSIFIMGFRIIILNNFLIINNYNGSLAVRDPKIQNKILPRFNGELLPTQEDDNAVLYKESDYFARSPRFVTSVPTETITITPPPAKQQEDDTPVIYTIGPMLTMAMSSAVSASTSVVTMLRGNGSVMSYLPTLLIAVLMVVSTLLWPTLTRRWQRNKSAKKEEERHIKYIEYLNEKRKKIEEIRINQFQVLTGDYPNPKNLENIILNRKTNLWERQIESADFLNVRLGLGNIPLKLDINYSEEEFTMTEDSLKEELLKVVGTAKDLENAPFTINLAERNKLVIIGDNKNKNDMLKSMIMQLVTYQSYNDLKLVFMVNNKENELWDSFKILPHSWSNSRDIRFFANEFDDMTKLSFYLEQIYTQRKYSEDDGKRVETGYTYKEVRPYYLIIVDDIKKTQNVEIIHKVLKDNGNIGFGLIILNDGLSNLPNECSDFLMAEGASSVIMTNDLNKENQKAFTMDNVDDLNTLLLCEKLSNIPIKLPTLLDDISSSVGFLEMYKVGKVEQLNVLDRWKTNNPVNSLSVPIGVHTDGEIFNLDLHEKFHGPHGLIAGMTGSGKSEFIITFILSMCLNFSPEEVSFVLIDYKGGGLTGAFENRLKNIKLPHLAGTITNLEKAEINRSLASIQSELKRRQALFNKAKMALNESTLDIYKYQKLYRDGKLTEPISHLFIISDEFAELKSDQPEFMSELISTARIGRSLGVHLILATQKPSGIVDDQIWSNSKFKVCLKVQEKADSMDVIKCPDAATLKKVGRFYLQVGYNDYFALGQAAYAGTKYIPKEKISKTVDRNISFINNIGDTLKSVETVKIEKGISMGEELPNILKYICDNASQQNIIARKLWLDKIPAEIFINGLMKEYNYVAEPWKIKPIIGEYDDPQNQKKHLLTLDFNDSGNTIIYGASGSGKEIAISSIIYSTIINHSADEVNFYILDFGTEMFGIFKAAPQVGDVAYISESEKVINLLGSLQKELDIRKKLFVEYNGNYETYVKNSGKTLPMIVVIINNYEMFTENYEDYIDTISGLSREGERYGLTFVITATGVNSVRGKTTQNFSNMLCLQFNDPSDYSSVLGSTKGMVPSEHIGRGLLKVEGIIHEFQTAYPYKWDDINPFIKSVCKNLANSLKQKAKNIKILPEHVRLEDISSYINSLSNIPIGIEKNSLNVARYDFNKYPISIVSTQDSSILDKFAGSLGMVFNKLPGIEFHMIDFGSEIKNASDFTNYYNSDASKVLEIIKDRISKTNELINIFEIIGLETFMNSLDSSSQSEFKKELEGLKANPSVKFVFADDVSKIKSIEYDSFYKNNVSNNTAIWISSGVNDQFTIKCTTYNKETRQQLPSDFGFVIDKGNAILVKLLDFYTE